MRYYSWSLLRVREAVAESKREKPDELAEDLAWVVRVEAGALDDAAESEDQYESENAVSASSSSASSLVLSSSGSRARHQASAPSDSQARSKSFRSSPPPSARQQVDR
jgi:hypothetical protein